MVTRFRSAVWLGCAALGCSFDAGGVGLSNDGLGASGTGASSSDVTTAAGSTATPTSTTMPGMTGSTGGVTTLTTADNTGPDVSTSSGPGPRDTDAVTTTETTTTQGSAEGSSDEPSSEGRREPAWAYARRVTVQGATAGLAGPVMDIPLPIELDDSRISYASAAVDGTDLRFIDELSGASLPYEIEIWDPTGVSVVWVEVPVVSAGAPTQLEMRYGNAEAADVQDAAAVWDNDYVMVHHLAQGCAGFADSTGAGHNAGCIDITDTALVPARFGNGMDFAGDGHLAVPDHPDFDLSTAVTFEAMVFITDATLSGGGSRRAFEKGNQFRLLPERTGPGGIRATVWANGGGARSASAGQSPLGWHLLVGLGISDDQVRLYLDGVLMAEQTVNGDLDLVDDEIRIGDSMIGGVDEVRLSSVARSADWIRLQASAAADALIDYGPEVEL